MIGPSTDARSPAAIRVRTGVVRGAPTHPSRLRPPERDTHPGAPPVG